MSVVDLTMFKGFMYWKGLPITMLFRISKNIENIQIQILDIKELKIACV
jgi:hypothetical protein